METDKKSARIFSMSRNKAGMSKEEVSLEMNLSRKTIWNWENGYSYPTFKQQFDWFRVLNLNPYPYLYAYYQGKEIPEDCKDILSVLTISDKRRCMMDFISYADERKIDVIYEIIYGEYGSDIDALLNLFLEHIKCDPKDKVSQASLTSTNFQMSKNWAEPSGVMPDTDLVKEAIVLAAEAYRKGLKKYNLEKRKEE